MALQRDDNEMGVDGTLPPMERMTRKLEGVGKEFLEAVYPEGYSPDVAAPKRKAPAVKKEPAAKKPKSNVNDDNFDMGSFIKNKTVHKLTVKDLKSYLESVNVEVSSSMKKAQLVESVYDYFEKK